jgi:GNAT superfamily N-acetyltransferase
MSAVIRRATEADLPTILALLASYYTEWDIWQRDSASTVIADLQHPTLGFLLAEVDSIPAGCVLGRALPQLDSAVECKRLFVAPAFRGRHIADLLMEALESAARTAGARWMYLDTRAEFATAIALYRRRGYQACERYNDNAQATLFLRNYLND